MTTTDEETMQYLDEFIRTGGTMRPIAKAVKDDDDEPVKGDDPNAYPPTLEGLAAYARSSDMQALKRSNPAAFREKYLGFVVNRELVAKGFCTAQQVGVWSHRLHQLPAPQPVRNQPLHKSVQHTEAVPRPWDFPATAMGLEAFLHSPEMLSAQRERPALWRRMHLDFFSTIQPAPMPQEISVKRQALELAVPDNPGVSVLAKALPGAHLTAAQSVIVSNFGSAFDPAVWLKA